VMSVIGISVNKKGEYGYKVKSSEADNSNTLTAKDGLLPKETVEWTARSVKFYYEKLMNDLNIPTDKIFIAGSSGVAMLKNEGDLKKEIQTRLYSYNPKVEFLSPEREAELTIRGTLPEKMRMKATLVDIGAGNIKGGYLVDESKQFYPFKVGYGTESFHELINKEKAAKKTDFNSTGKQLVGGVMNELKKEFAAKAILKSRKDVCMVGGIVWALSTYLYPQNANDAFVNLKAEDISKFKNMALLTYDKLIKPDLSKVSGETREKADKDILACQQVFNKESMVSGALLLDAIASELNQPTPDKNFYFARSGYVGWISGYIVQSVEAAYRNFTE
jgi:hypothetical protein